MGNRLSNIYTKTGDVGSTSLGNGERIDKASIRIEVIGDVDELNSLFGLLVATQIPEAIAELLLEVQQRLFDIGAEFAIPAHRIIDASVIEKLEILIDAYNKDLPPLKEFILPGGAIAAATCHLTRSVCRRAERHGVKLSQIEAVNPESLRYLNRLSDLLFVLARVLNQGQGTGETFWQSARLKSE